MKKINKIYVLGHCGAGTTTLSKKLSERMKIPCYDMDDVRFIKKFTKVRTSFQRKKIVDKLLKNKKWIFDARGTEWDKHAMKNADLIIWLRTPAYRRIIRIMKRYFQRRKDKDFEEKFKEVFSLIKYSLRFRYGIKSTSFKPLKEYLEKNNLHPKIIKTNLQLKRFLKEEF